MKYSGPPSPVHYPYFYAESVVYKFIDKYSRVVHFIAKKIGMEPSEFTMLMIKLFMYQNGAWNSIRDTLKYVDKHRLIDEIAHYSRIDTLNYLTKIKYIVQDSLIDKELLLKRD